MLKTKLLLPIIALLVTSSCSSKGGGFSVIYLSSTSNPTSSSEPISSSNPGSSSIFQQQASYDAFMLNSPNKAFNTSESEVPSDGYVRSLNELSKSLFKNVFDSQNQVFSAISIANCFSMLLDGAKEETKEELEAFLNYDTSFNHLDEIKNTLLRNAINDEKNNVFLDISQSFWSDSQFAKEQIKQSYVDTLTNYYFAEAFNGDLKSDAMHKALADFINDKTHNFLNVKKEDFEEYKGVLWLLNTIYLKSPWAEAFYDRLNRQDTFTNIDSSEKIVTYMFKTETGFVQERNLYTIANISLLYGLNFNILLPTEGSDYAEVLSSDKALSDLHRFQDNQVVINRTRGKIKYQIPQFKIQKSLDLKALLSKMGVNYAFDPDLANLTDIANLNANENLYVTKAKHEAGIEIKNEGLEAAAYTIGAADATTAVEPPLKEIPFIVDHPFAFSVTNRDNIPLFTGVVTNL